MKQYKVIFDRSWEGHPFLVRKGQLCTVSLGQGTKLKKQQDNSWVDSVMSDEVHEEDTVYKIDCVDCSGPVESTWTIEDVPQPKVPQ